MTIRKRLARGFTIVELLVSIVIIGILATISFVVYNGLQAKAHDVSVMSDLDTMDALQARYAINHKTAGKSYYSINGSDTALGFTPSQDNVIQVIVSSTDYCIRGYNANGTKNSITNSAYKESSPGVCSTLLAIDPPATPVVNVGLNSGLIRADITPLTCTSGTIQYHFKSRTNDGAWTDYTDWSSASSATQTATEGVKYGYVAQARCYSSDSLFSSFSENSESTYTYPVNPPATPVITSVALVSGSINVVSSAVTCTAPGASVQYQFDVRTNDGSWSTYAAWSGSNTTTQTPTEGTKYGYRAEARCYLSPTVLSTATVGVEGPNYIHPITTAPATLTVTNSTPDWYWTYYSWNTPTCPGSSVPRYQYHYYTNYGYDSGWVATSGNGNNFTTAKIGYYYTNDAQAQCYSPYSTGPWSATGWSQYYRPVPNVHVLIVAGGGGGGFDNGGGGGGGGVLDLWPGVYSQGYGVGIGGGGGPQANGGNSSIFGNTAYGGGRGGNVNTTGATGGSGGGGGGTDPGNTNYSGNYQPGGYSNIGGRGGWRQGGSCNSTHYYAGGGGGGAGGQGGDAWSGGTGPGTMQGGVGFSSGISGNTYAYGAGGGGGGDNCSSYWGSGGSNGGGSGAWGRGATGSNASYYGAGGGGGSGRSGQGGSGYQGIVIVRYPIGSLDASGGSKYQSGSDYVHVFTGNDTFTVSG